MHAKLGITVLKSCNAICNTQPAFHTVGQLQVSYSSLFIASEEASAGMSYQKSFLSSFSLLSHFGKQQYTLLCIKLSFGIICSFMHFSQ